MTRMISIRLPEEVISSVDRARKRASLTRTAAIHEALRLWVRQLRYEQAVRLDREGYTRRPVREEEFEPILGAQRWPK